MGISDWIVVLLFASTTSLFGIDAFSIIGSTSRRTHATTRRRRTNTNTNININTNTNTNANTNANTFTDTTRRSRSIRIILNNQKEEEISEVVVPKQKQVHIEVIASAGLTNEELPLILSTASEGVHENFGLDFRTNNANVYHTTQPAIPNTIPGATGRVLLLSLNNVNVADEWEVDDERLDPFKNVISQQIDALVGYQIHQPVLVSIRPNYHKRKNEENHNDDDDDDNEDHASLFDTMKTVVQNEAMVYGLCSPMVSDAVINEEQLSPTIQVEIDGAMVPDPYGGEEGEMIWDTSTVLIFDEFVEDSLRERLLDVVNKRDGDEYDWDDKKNGPDPKRWERGGLMDTFEDDVDQPTCWGLSDEATNELCFEHHTAIAEVEQKISDLFAADFIVTRLPEAVLGSCVSPLTANAPTYGDSFAYHIDADPNQTPPSPWTDVFGRYFNRVRGKPRFVSCLLYLNDEWDDALGAPTQFYDPPTESNYQVYPRPNRLVMMDQDVTHTVVAPNKNAGSIPRYSLVWKLILHPKRERQSMKLPSGESVMRIGSANSDQ